MVCQFQILDLLKPLIEIIQGLPNPPGPAIARFSKRPRHWRHAFWLEPLRVSCLLFATCFVSRFEACTASFTTWRTISALQDAGTVSASEVQNVLDSYAPVAGILELAGGLFQVAGLGLPRALVLPVGDGPELAERGRCCGHQLYRDIADCNGCARRLFIMTGLL